MAGDRFVQQTDEERGLIRAGADQLLRLLTALPGRRPALKRAQIPLLTERGFDLDRVAIKGEGRSRWRIFLDMWVIVRLLVTIFSASMTHMISDYVSPLGNGDL